METPPFVVTVAMFFAVACDSGAQLRMKKYTSQRSFLFLCGLRAAAYFRTGGGFGPLRAGTSTDGKGGGSSYIDVDPYYHKEHVQ